MWLRKNIERVWPLGENEVHLSEKARSSVLIATYNWPPAWWIPFYHARSFVAPTDPKIKNFGYVSVRHDPRATSTTIKEHYHTYQVYSSPPEYDGFLDHQTIFTPDADVAAEFKKPEVLNRANHVERVARRIKLSAGALLAAGAVALGVTEVASADQIHNARINTGTEIHMDDGSADQSSAIEATPILEMLQRFDTAHLATSH